MKKTFAAFFLVSVFSLSVFASGAGVDPNGLPYILNNSDITVVNNYLEDNNVSYLESMKIYFMNYFNWLLFLPWKELRV